MKRPVRRLSMRGVCVPNDNNSYWMLGWRSKRGKVYWDADTFGETFREIHSNAMDKYGPCAYKCLEELEEDGYIIERVAVVTLSDYKKIRKFL